MLNATQEQLLERLKVLSPGLQDAFYSYDVTKKIWAAAEQFGLKAKKGIIAEVVGYALAAFLHPDALAPELQEAAGIDEAAAKKLADELNKTVFAPYRAEIEKAYAPPGTARPKAAASAPQPLPAVPRMADLAPRPAPLPPTAASGSLPSTKQQAPAPLMPRPVAPAPAPSLNATPSTPNPAPAPTPFMMRSNPVAEQAVSSSGWKIDLNSDLFKKTLSTSSGQGASGMKPAIPPRPAQLEIGAIPTPPTTRYPLNATPSPSIPHTISPEARVVHYVEPKISTGIPAAPAAAKAEAGKPVPPAPPSVPKLPVTDHQLPITSTPKINPFEKAPVVPAPRPIPAAPADLPVAPRTDKVNAPASSMPAPAAEPKKPPKIVNFGPEGDLK